jgi:hypothetical protein
VGEVSPKEGLDYTIIAGAKGQTLKGTWCDVWFMVRDANI